jgi:hypothetical protein
MNDTIKTRTDSYYVDITIPASTMACLDMNDMKIRLVCAIAPVSPVAPVVPSTMSYMVEAMMKPGYRAVLNTYMKWMVSTATSIKAQEVEVAEDLQVGDMAAVDYSGSVPMLRKFVSPPVVNPVAPVAGEIKYYKTEIALGVGMKAY